MAAHGRASKQRRTSQGSTGTGPDAITAPGEESCKSARTCWRSASSPRLALQARPRRRTRRRQTPRTSTPSSSPASAPAQEKSLDVKREAEGARGGGHRRGRRQDARQERGRLAAARARRDHQLGRRQRGGLRRERPRVDARHQRQPDADPDQRARGVVGRLVRAEPGARTPAAASASPCCRRSLVSQVVVRKTARGQACVEGGRDRQRWTSSPGSRWTSPKQLTGEVSIGGRGHSPTLPGKTDPQLSALFNYRSTPPRPLRRAGCRCSIREARSLRRDGVEVLGYDQITNAVGSPTKPVADAQPRPAPACGTRA
jgi:hypothetical protein